MSIKRRLLSWLNHPLAGRLAGAVGAATRARPKLGGLSNPFFVSDYLLENGELVCHAPTDSYLNRKALPSARVRFSAGAFEPEVQYLMRRIVKPTDVVLDIGANVGAHTILLARLAHRGHVFAFEPVAEMAERNSLNCALNGLDNVTIVRCGLGATDGALDMNVNVAGSGFEGTSSFLASAHVVDRPGNYISRQLPVRRLDDLISELGLTSRIGFIKMDTEGFEPLVIDGARQTLATHRPAMIVEAHTTRLAKLGRSFAWYRETFPDYHILLSPEPTPANPFLQLIPLTCEPPETCVNLVLLPRIRSISPSGASV